MLYSNQVLLSFLLFETKKKGKIIAHINGYVKDILTQYKFFKKISWTGWSNLILIHETCHK